ncbi:STAS-like domain-containing protein [Shewanella algae]|uniref:STAS-like domain-containing protein n=1 Tax=Shewanella algae TaxID=38313 RepID=UPI003004CD15
MKYINVRDFSKFPGPRYIKLGPYSGEEFRDNHLIPFIQNTDGQFGVDLDGVIGYGSSFLEEAFGGLVRKGIPTNKIRQIREHIKSDDDPSLVDEIREYIDDALNADR